MTDGLLDTESGNAVAIALDHGLALGAPEKFQDPGGTLRAVLDGNPDAVLASPPFATEFRDELRESDTDVVVTADAIPFSTLPGMVEDQDLWTRVFDIDTLLAVEPVAVKMIFVFGREDRHLFLENIRTVGELSRELRGTGVPLAVEPVMWGKRIPDEEQRKPEYVANACRMAWEFGADILKVPYTGDPDSFAEIVDHSPVPVMVLGGAARGGIEDLFAEVEEAVAAGARGTMIGRRAWQLEDPAQVVEALGEIVHDGASADAVWPR